MSEKKKNFDEPPRQNFTLALFCRREREKEEDTHEEEDIHNTYIRIILIIIMGRTPVKLKEVIYGISSNKVEIMGSLGRDALSAISKKIGGGWFDVTVFGIAPTVGTVMYVILFSLSSFIIRSSFVVVSEKDGVLVSLSLVLFLNAERATTR
jgi:hypothetical protein